MSRHSLVAEVVYGKNKTPAISGLPRIPAPHELIHSGVISWLISSPAPGCDSFIISHHWLSTTEADYCVPLRFVWICTVKWWIIHEEASVKGMVSSLLLLHRPLLREDKVRTATYNLILVIKAKAGIIRRRCSSFKIVQETRNKPTCNNLNSNMRNRNKLRIYCNSPIHHIVLILPTLYRR